MPRAGRLLRRSRTGHVGAGRRPSGPSGGRPSGRGTAANPDRPSPNRREWPASRSSAHPETGDPGSEAAAEMTSAADLSPGTACADAGSAGAAPLLSNAATITPTEPGGTVVAADAPEPVPVRPSSPPTRPGGLAAETIAVLIASGAHPTAEDIAAGSDASPPPLPNTVSASVVTDSPLASVEVGIAAPRSGTVESPSSRSESSFDADRLNAPAAAGPIRALGDRPSALPSPALAVWDGSLALPAAVGSVGDSRSPCRAIADTATKAAPRLPSGVSKGAGSIVTSTLSRPLPSSISIADARTMARRRELLRVLS